MQGPDPLPTPREKADALRGTAAGSGVDTVAAAYPQSPANLDVIMQLPVLVRVVLGSATMEVAALARLGRGAVVALDRKVGEPVDVMVNGRIVARGEVVVLEEDDSRFGISLTEVVGVTTPSRRGG